MDAGEYRDIWNSRPSGELVHEGKARLIRPANGLGWWVVEFVDELGQEYERFVDETKQGIIQAD